MGNSTLTTNPQTYAQLLKAIRGEITSAQKTIEHTQAKSYWKIGKLISQHLLFFKDRAGYGEQLFVRLSKNLKIDQTTLYQSVRFYETYPILSARVKLDWTHYRSLLAIPDQTARNRLFRKAIRQNLSSRQLEKEISQKRLTPKTINISSQTVKLSVIRGKLYTYKLIDSQKISAPEGNVMVDCGFNIWREIRLKKTPQLNPKAIYESVKDSDNYSLKLLSVQPQELYTYKAFMERIIDGDTLWVKIDCGFNTWVRQKLRLKSIDAPEIPTKKGQSAKRFVQQTLKRCEFLVVKTYQSDKYDRYLADIFYLPMEKDENAVAAQGELLNQKLLDERLANTWRD